MARLLTHQLDCASFYVTTTAVREIARRAMNGSAAFSPIDCASFYVTTTAVREIARRAMNGSAAFSPIDCVSFMLRRQPSVK